MKKYILVAALCMGSIITQAQNLIKFKVASDEKAPLNGVTIICLNQNGSQSTDSNGIANFTGLPAGNTTFIFSLKGWESVTKQFMLPYTGTLPVEIEMEESEEDLDEVKIVSTRSSRSIKDVATRVEVLGTDEIEEKSNMTPGSIQMMLNESSGINVQQTGVASGNASIRIQGLEGRYTQLLKDGMPLYAGYAGGLSILQIPPLDLKQVEIIKGSSSTLYGGGAIAGMINLVSKTPTDKMESTSLINIANTGSVDASTWFSKKLSKKFGITLLAMNNYQKAYDPANINLSAIPTFNRVTVNPRLFWYMDKKSTLTLGLNGSIENRLGGNMDYIKNPTVAGAYFERNQSKRLSSQLTFDRQVDKEHRLQVKNSVNSFYRNMESPSNGFKGKQLSSFSEISYALDHKKFDWVIGANLWTENFSRERIGVADTLYYKMYQLTTVGMFANSQWNVSKKVVLETGLRTDYVSQLNKVFVLPRVSTLIRYNNQWSSRIGGGIGYKAPTIFTEEAEQRGYVNFKTINFSTSLPENSTGFNADVTYKATFLRRGHISVNQLFYYTHLNRPLVLQGNEFVNTKGHIDSKGFETNLKLRYKELVCFVGYWYTDTKRHTDTLLTVMPLTAKHRLSSTIMYEKHGKLRIGLEIFYTGKQTLSTGLDVHDYWNLGILVEKRWKKVAVYFNLENFLDARQTKYGSIYTGTVSQPVFSEIWAPLDGRTFNGGVKLYL
ncbi:MAG: TonB-dependent receptor [Flavobacteriaceae bacterium]|nr:TonB-dependent receptor [Flavobacteriaceae bacterium]